jgi:hypothetical protein
VGLQTRAFLVQGDRFLQRGLAGFELLDDLFEALQGVLEAEVGGDGGGFSHGRRP